MELCVYRAILVLHAQDTASDKPAGTEKMQAERPRQVESDHPGRIRFRPIYLSLVLFIPTLIAALPVVVRLGGREYLLNLLVQHQNDLLNLGKPPEGSIGTGTMASTM